MPTSVLAGQKPAAGLLFAAHGAQKLFGWFGGEGLGADNAGFEHMGLDPGALFGALAGLSELASGLLPACGVQVILISLDTQHHIMPPARNAEEQLFLYPALDRSRTNLALARHQLRRVEQAIRL